MSFQPLEIKIKCLENTSEVLLIFEMKNDAIEVKSQLDGHLEKKKTFKTSVLRLPQHEKEKVTSEDSSDSESDQGSGNVTAIEKPPKISQKRKKVSYITPKKGSMKSKKKKRASSDSSSSSEDDIKVLKAKVKKILQNEPIARSLATKKKKYSFNSREGMPIPPSKLLKKNIRNAAVQDSTSSDEAPKKSKKEIDKKIELMKKSINI